MDGIEFIRRLMPQYPIPVVVVSSVSNAIFDALNAGAVEFVAKPDTREIADAFIERLKKKIKIASKAKLKINNNYSNKKLPQQACTHRNLNKIELIAMGASTGGTEALHYVIKTLPNEIPGIVIVQHIPPVFSKMFSDRLDSQTGFNVKEAKEAVFILLPVSRILRLKSRVTDSK
jgi:two-component system chemotaxis response regulator CheB